MQSPKIHCRSPAPTRKAIKEHTIQLLRTTHRPRHFAMKLFAALALLALAGSALALPACDSTVADGTTSYGNSPSCETIYVGENHTPVGTACVTVDSTGSIAIVSTSLSNPSATITTSHIYCGATTLPGFVPPGQYSCTASWGSVAPPSCATQGITVATTTVTTSVYVVTVTTTPTPCSGTPVADPTTGTDSSFASATAGTTSAPAETGSPVGGAACVFGVGEHFGFDGISDSTGHLDGLPYEFPTYLGFLVTQSCIATKTTSIGCQETIRSISYSTTTIEPSCSTPSTSTTPTPSPTCGSDTAFGYLPSTAFTSWQGTRWGLFLGPVAPGTDLGIGILVAGGSAFSNGPSNPACTPGSGTSIARRGSCGTNVGSFSVQWSGSGVSFSFSTAGGVVVKDAHLNVWCGSSLPDARTQSVYAFGQWPGSASYCPSGASTGIVGPVALPTCASGTYYIAVHMSVAYATGDCTVGGCSGARRLI
ncbi:hypothetical protein DFJ74DRAFT_770787 [Hyaloraphidium curvatum]|nr:hypothetical protein DFJ74DRAFT_770787 [Hyaloraphidium curvatum]